MKKMIGFTLFCLLISACQTEENYTIETIFSVTKGTDSSTIEECADILRNNVKTLGYDTANVSIAGSNITLKSAIKDTGEIEIQRYNSILNPMEIKIWQTLEYIPVTSIMLFDSIPSIEGLEYVNFKAEVLSPRSHMAYTSDASKFEYFKEQLEKRLLAPEKVRLVWSETAYHDKKYVLYILNNTHLGIKIGTEHFAEVSAVRNEQTATSQVMIKMDQDGKGMLSDMTTQAISRRSEIAIVKNGRVLSAPTVNNPILNGTISLIDIKDHQEAMEFAGRVKMRPYSCELKIISQDMLEELK